MFSRRQLVRWQDLGTIGGMTSVEIRYDKAAVKFLQGLPKKLRDSIREALRG